MSLKNYKTGLKKRKVNYTPLSPVISWKGRQHFPKLYFNYK